MTRVRLASAGDVNFRDGPYATDDDALAERCRVMALHGISKDGWKRYTAEESWS